VNTVALDTRCRIEYKSVTLDPVYGSEVIEWKLLAVRWCSLQDVLPSRFPSEEIRQGLNVAKNQTRVRLRYCTDIDSSMRLVVYLPQRTVLQIVAGPAVLGNKEGIELMVEKYSS